LSKKGRWSLPQDISGKCLSQKEAAARVGKNSQQSRNPRKRMEKPKRWFNQKGEREAEQGYLRGGGKGRLSKESVRRCLFRGRGGGATEFGVDPPLMEKSEKENGGGKGGGLYRKGEGRDELV